MEFAAAGVVEEVLLEFTELSNWSTNCTDWDAALISFVTTGEEELFRSL